MPLTDKFPRTLHFPWSPGTTEDDEKHTNVESFLHRALIVTEKMDGSNSCLEREDCFARSHSKKPKGEVFDAFKALHANVKHLIPEGLQFFGEWLYAKHSIKYTALPGLFLLFGVRDLKTRRWYSWADTEACAKAIGVSTVPVLDRNDVGLNRPWKVNALSDTHSRMPSRCGGEREGFCLRWASSFRDDEWREATAKFVRANHVKSDTHWLNQPIERNGLA